MAGWCFKAKSGRAVSFICDKLFIFVSPSTSDGFLDKRLGATHFYSSHKVGMAKCWGLVTASFWVWDVEVNAIGHFVGLDMRNAGTIPTQNEVICMLETTTRQKGRMEWVFANGLKMCLSIR